eukprot:CAMPEP_0119314274 /NCGR_PEP_ID=MMETSP1333-20130426/32278_1 /TAXON_ID=418940 /ORGANISM="Scyphosphaera apsteinii, Strain RCC1455" /LENGTH=125 /DNA_ID=CAMNT_0007319355 /DNA_START=127 /DNA_END=504 /DNA_ORIENTATION=-
MRQTWGAELKPTLEPDGQHPPELLGPWEFRSSVSGVEETWVELAEGGDLSCSARVGRGHRWFAERVGQQWQLSVTLLDKLNRPLTFVGEVRETEYVFLEVAGAVRRVPKPGSTQVVGEFRGFKLE